MKRASDQRLEEIKARGIPIYSISRLDTINRCLYEAYRTYILHEKGRDSCYALMGGKIHDILEGITNGVNTEADLLPAMYDELENIEMLGLEFPKDMNGNDTIKDHWVQNMTHFCNTYRAPKGKKLTAEELFIYETPAGHILQGYIDLQYLRKDGSIDIFDYKTSSMYSGQDFKDHSRQLITYALGKEQEGFKVNSASFIFLKYANIKFEGQKTARSKEKTQLSKDIERYKIARELERYVSDDLIAAGFDELQIDGILTKFRKTKMIEDLPEEIRDNYKMSPCVIAADLSDEAKQECINYIDNTIAIWESLNGKVGSYPPKNFTKITKTGKEVDDCFFCTTLCAHYNQCPYICDYLHQKNIGIDEEESLF